MKIAIIGSGISGLSATWLLNHRHDVRLFESLGRLGGHTHTIPVETEGGRLGLDTGFVVFNRATYPNFTRLLDRLDVESQSSDMSFSVSCAQPDIEYAVHSMRGLFANPAQIVSPAFLRMLTEIMRFGRRGREILASAPDATVTIGDFVASEGFSSYFARYYLYPMTGAIWSSGSGLVSAYPRDALLRFLDNHRLLQVSGQPEWRTIVGGSSTYVDRMTSEFEDRIITGVGVRRVVRNTDDVEIHLEDGSMTRFDHVVIATHADQALALLHNPTASERELLGSWSYSRNDTWLHTDTRLLPRRPAAWASWNYLVPPDGRQGKQVSVTYHLNRLQNISSETQYLVTLNPPHTPDPDTVLARMTYTHPAYTTESVASQKDLPSLNGRFRTHFCGAYFRNGFHEDGLASAISVAEDLGVSYP
jgi:predicted NAD/FAD-binding protein